MKKNKPTLKIKRAVLINKKMVKASKILEMKKELSRYALYENFKEHLKEFILKCVHLLKKEGIYIKI